MIPPFGGEQSETNSASKVSDEGDLLTKGQTP